MKKTTLFILAMVASITINAQITVQDATEGTHETILNTQTTNAAQQEACSQGELSNSAENGFGDTNSGTEVADDITIPDGEQFSVETLTLNMITAGVYPEITIGFFEDNGSGLPGEEVSRVSYIPTSVTDIGDAFGRDLLEVIVTFDTPILLEGVDGQDTRYWVSVTSPLGNGADSFWETNITGTISNPTPLSTRNVADEANPTDWTNDDGTTPPAAVFLVSGDCDVLSVNDNTLANNISVYPNPTNGDLNINFARNFGTTNIAIINVNGQTVLNASIEGIGNNTLATSKLATGIYFAQITAEDGSTTTSKIIKN